MVIYCKCIVELTGETLQEQVTRAGAKMIEMNDEMNVMWMSDASDMVGRMVTK